MLPKLLLRIAALLMLFHAIGHTMGFSKWKQATDPAKQEVIKQMTGPKFLFMGTWRSLGDNHDGFGYSATMLMLLLISMLWIASGLKEDNAGIAIKILIPVTLFLFLLGVDEIMFFFPFAVAFSMLSAVLSLVAIVMLYKAKKRQQNMSL